MVRAIVQVPYRPGLAARGAGSRTREIALARARVRQFQQCFWK
ncbi:MAG TPA: hypothetical protein VJ959_14275 [Desulfotignum sp.]|nr:hypothetical protein [Desulfotignum sp.]